MTLLFFLRTPGNLSGGTTTTVPIDTGKTYSHFEALRYERSARKAKKREERELARLMAQSLHEGFEEAARIERRKRQKRNDEDALVMLFMHEFDGYDD